MANQLLEAYRLRNDQIDQIESYKKSIQLQKFYNILMKRTENYLEMTKKIIIEKNIYDEENFNIHVNFTMKVAYLIFTLDVLFFAVKNGVSKMKSLLAEKTKLKECGLDMERKTKDMEEKYIELNNNQTKSDENILNEKLKLQKNIVKEFNNVMFSSQSVGNQNSKSVLNFVTNVVTADDLNLLANQKDYANCKSSYNTVYERDFIQINGEKI
ncbi:MAG: hypothetical protein H9Q67_06835, partial [Spiroplasma ixodetis]|nr:hypothetical protein [Spiroplasma ixodetis]